MYSDGLLKLRIFTIQKNFKILLTVYSLSPLLYIMQLFQPDYTLILQLFQPVFHDFFQFFQPIFHAFL